MISKMGRFYLAAILSLCFIVGMIARGLYGETAKKKCAEPVLIDCIGDGRVQSDLDPTCVNWFDCVGELRPYGLVMEIEHGDGTVIVLDFTEDGPPKMHVERKGEGT